MNELQHIGSTPPMAMGTDPALPTIDVAGPGHKRDAAGVLEYWQMVRRHKAGVALAAVGGSIIGFLLTLSDPRVFQARTTLELQGLNQNFLNMGSVTPVSDSNGYLESDVQTQVKILQSRLMLDRVRRRIEAQPRPEGLQPADRLGMWRKALGLRPQTAEEVWNQALGTAGGGVRVRSSLTNRIIDISCDSTHAQLAADFCNTLTQEYIDQNLEARWKAAEYTGEWLTKQLQDLKIKLEKQEEELQTYARTTGLVFTDEKNDVEHTKLADVQKELSVAQADRISKQSRFEMAQTSPGHALPDVLDDPALKESQRRVDELQARLAQLTVTYTPNHSEVRKVQAQITAIDASLENARLNALTRVRKDFEGAQRREALLESMYQDQARLVSGQGQETARYALLKRDVDATHLLYDTLQQRLKEASIAAALRANNIRVVDAAETPGAPYKPDVSQKTTVGLMFGLILGLTFSVLRERADRTLQDPGDVSHYLNVPELGVVPVGELMEIPKPRGKNKTRALVTQTAGEGGLPKEKIEMVSWDQKASLLAESFRTTLTSILFSRRTGDRPHVLVLTSASPKEGKTTVVSNLAISLAEINHRVLVIDADMRRPRLHNVFNVENNLGLSDLLMRKASIDSFSLEEACASTAIPGLYVMPSGASRRNVSSLLHSARLPELIALARQKFDTVVIDTPPMVNIADARVVARFGDGLILVVRSGHTTRDAALLAKARFTDDGIPMLGTILNFWNPKTPGYSHYRYYYQGYHHYYGNGDGGDTPDHGKADDGDRGPGTGEPRAHSSFWKRGLVFEPQSRRDSASPEGDH